MEARYDWRGFLYSNAPFMVRTFGEKPQSDDDNRQNVVEHETDFFPIPVSLPDHYPRPASLLSGLGGGMDNDDSFGDNFRRPPFMPMQLKGGFNMLMVPVLRLPSDWITTLSGDRLSHWLLGEPDYDTGINLLMRFDHSPPVQISVSHAEYRELAELLTNTRQLLHWLAPRLSGRAAFIQQLLSLQAELENSSGGSSTLDQTAREAIEDQLAIVLEQPDTEFNLEFETLELAATMSSSAAIIQANGDGKKTKKTGQQGKGKQSSESSASGGAVGNSSGKRKKGDKAKEQADNGNTPPDDLPASSGSLAAALPDAYELIINGERFSLQAEAVSSQFLRQKDIKDIKVHSASGVKGKHDIRLSKIEEKTGIPEQHRLPRDAKALDFFLLYGTEETVRKLHRRHPPRSFRLPEEELEKASNAIFAALYDRPMALKALARNSHFPLVDAIHRDLPACLERLLEGYRPSSEHEGAERLIHLAITCRKDKNTGTIQPSTSHSGNFA